ncbi:Conserved membrane protein of uncharacterised function [Mycobacterium tuberculosis]|nr:Conserved membrane protein of uncharacterised function [Mycobacterium tuberculosis]
MTAAPNDWDVVLRPHWTPLFAYAAAFLIAVAHVAGGLLLKVGSSGVVFQTADQVAMGALGLGLAGAVLLFARPRLRGVLPGFRCGICWVTGSLGGLK